MITFPDGFVATKFPGYFWNTTYEKLYTMKVTGVLRPMRIISPPPGQTSYESYRVSVNGVRRRLTTAQIKRALVRGTGTVPVANP